MSPTTPTNSRSFATSAISGHLDTRTAAMEVAEQLELALAGPCDLVMMFASFHHTAAFEEAAATLRRTLTPTVIMAVSCETVLGGDQELEGLAGLSAIALRLGGATLHPFTSTPDDPIRISKPETIPEHIGLGEDHRVTLLLGDPFSTPIARLLPALTECGGEKPVIIAGGMASGASQPGHNRVLMNDHFSPVGAVGVTISGSVDVDFVVSQGCRPIGKPLVVTKAQQNVIMELGGLSAMDSLKELASSLPDHEKQLLTNGLLLGTVINEYKDHFGRGDFLVRNVLGFDEKKGGIATGELCKVGQKIQFHVRDAKTASEDLQLLLDAQQLKKPPFGALLFTCNGRGERLFEEPNHDLSMIHERLGDVPTAGFFCAGELGPIGDKSFLHGHTASLVMFREK